MSAKKKILKVQGIDISVSQFNEQDYISITDMIKAKDGDFFVSDWLRNRNTLEYIGAWESMHNPNFNYGEFAIIKDKSGLNNFKISVKEFVTKTNAISIRATAGRYGGTYAHVDIAFDFGMWISPVFRLYIVEEYKRLKEAESKNLDLEWNVKRIISKANYSLHTDAIKEHIIPFKNTNEKEEWIYANEADMLNLIVFGSTAKQWRDNNTQLASKGKNIRDNASINELAVLSNIESLNATLITQGIDKKTRYEFLLSTAQDQLNRLRRYSFVNKIEHSPQLLIAEKSKSSFDNKLTQALNYNPHKDKRNQNEDNEE